MTSFSMFAGVSNYDKLSLLKLYNATNGVNWKVKWNLSAPVDNWYGIKLEGSKIVEINLENNNLTGTLPAEIVNLADLIKLDLSRNGITGTIPENIQELKSLESLNLSFNKISGKIPENICQLSNLI